MNRSLLSAVVAAGVIGTSLVIAPASSADVDTSYSAKVTTWQEAADSLGTAGSLWSPQVTAGLPLKGKLDAAGREITVKDGTATGGETTAGATYEKGKRRIDLVEKWAQTDWAFDPSVDIRRVLVRRVALQMGDPGMRYTVRAEVFANCYTKALSGDAPPPPSSLRCTESDVLKYGGTLRMTMRPGSTMTEPGRTSIQIDTTGVTYAQLLRMARSLEQAQGAPTVAGSAQMLGMCAQMVDGRMTADQARAFAESNGYILRVGTIDGVPQAVTMDYRTERFTVSTVSGVVTGCTYG